MCGGVLVCVCVCVCVFVCAFCLSLGGNLGWYRMTGWLGDRLVERSLTGSLPAGRVEHSRARRLEVTPQASSSTSCHLHFHSLGFGTAADPVPPGRKLSSWTISQYLVGRKNKKWWVCIVTKKIKRAVLSEEHLSVNVCLGKRIFDHSAASLYVSMSKIHPFQTWEMKDFWVHLSVTASVLSWQDHYR